MELRRGKRFQLSAPAFFCWESPEGNLQEGCGTTRDISAMGVFVLCDCNPSLGGRIVLDVYLPSVGPAGKGMQLHAEGKVIRADRRDGKDQGFAAEAIFQTGNSGMETTLDRGQKLQ